MPAVGPAPDDGHLMMENRNALIVDARLTEANGTAERATALDMIDDNAALAAPWAATRTTTRPISSLAVASAAAHRMYRRTIPTAARRSTRTTRHPGYRISTIKRKQIEEALGWMKTVGGLRKTRHCGRTLVEWFFVLTATAYNLVRIPKILAATR
jgi:Transposase DDE domain